MTLNKYQSAKVKITLEETINHQGPYNQDILIFYQVRLTRQNKQGKKLERIEFFNNVLAAANYFEKLKNEMIS